MDKQQIERVDEALYTIRLLRKATMVLGPLNTTMFAISAFVPAVRTRTYLSVNLTIICGALWGLLPFLVLAVAGVWFALQRSYHSGQLREELQIDRDHVHLTRVNPRGDTQTWDCNSHWARAYLHPTEGPVPNYITLRGKGREVELGAFLSEEERKTLYGEVQSALSAARQL